MKDAQLPYLLRSDPGTPEEAPVDLAAPVQSALRQALSEDVDLMDDIFAALPDHAPNQQLQALLRSELSEPIDISNAVLESLPDQRLTSLLNGALASDTDVVEDVLSALPDARLSQLLQENLGTPVDFSDAVLDSLPDARLTAALREALSLPVDVSGAVMAQIAPRRPQLRVLAGGRGRHQAPAPQPEVVAIPQNREHLWRWLPLGVLAAGAAILLLTLIQSSSSPSSDPLAAHQPPASDVFALNAHNDASVDIAFAASSVQVMQFDDDGPTFILVDEDAPPNPTVPM